MIDLLDSYVTDQLKVVDMLLILGVISIFIPNTETLDILNYVVLLRYYWHYNDCTMVVLCLVVIICNLIEVLKYI